MYATLGEKLLKIMITLHSDIKSHGILIWTHPYLRFIQSVEYLTGMALNIIVTFNVVYMTAVIVKLLQSRSKI